MTEQQTRPNGPRRGEATAELSVASTVRTGSGVPVVIEVTVTNTGTVASAFSVMAQGLDAAWLPAPVSTPVLGPEQSASVALRIVPAVGTLSAQYPMAVTAEAVDPSGEGGGARTVADLVLVVSPRAQIAMELSPTSVTAWRERGTTLIVRNTGVGVADVQLKPVTTGSLKIRLAKEKLAIGPGESTKVRVRMVATRPQLVGITMRHRYRILARGMEAERHAEGEFVQHPLIAPVWMKVLGFALILAVWVGAGVVFVPKLSNLVGNNPASISAADIANGVIGGAKAVKGNGNGNGKGNGSGKGGGNGGGGNGGGNSKGSGTKTGGGPAGGQGKTAKPATVQLNGTVTAKDPSGVTVTLKPTSLVDEAASSGAAKPVGLTGAVLSGFETTGKVSPLGRVLRSSVSKEPTSRSVVTGADGAWTFAGVKSPGYYLVTFAKPGYQTYSYVVDSSAASAQDPLPVTMTAGEGSLSGIVKGPDGKPVGGAAITITDGTSTISASSNTTGNVGHWQVTGLSTPSTYTVSASKNGMSLESKLVDLPASGSLTVDLTLRAGVATLTGTILGADSTGAVVGIGGASVTVSDGQDVTRTATTITEGDLAGTFTVPSLPAPGDYTVTLSADGYSPRTSKLHIAAGQGSVDLGSATLVTSLGTVQGTVKEKLNGTGLVGAGMTLTSDTNSYKTTTTSTGDFRINGVAPGTYTLTTQMFGYGDDVATVTVAAGGTAAINPVLTLLPNGVLPATATIKGSAVDGTTGKPLTACATTTQSCLTATLVAPGTADGRRGGSSVSTSFAEGDSYSLGGLLPGTYSITITAPGYAAASVIATVGEGQTATAPVAQLFPAPHLQGTLNILQGTPTSSTCVFAVSSSNTAFPTSCPSSGQAEPKTGAKCFASPAAPAQYGTTNPTAMCAYTDIANHYRIDLPQDGSWTVYVVPSDPDYIPVGITQATASTWSSSSPATFTLQHGATQDYSPTLGRYGHIQVTVQRPNSQNQLSTLTAPVDVYVTRDTTTAPGVIDHTPFGIFTTSAGIALITGLVPGDYTLSATDPVTNAVGTIHTTIALNQTVNVNLPLVGPVSPYVGRLLTTVDGTPVPVVGATVTLTAPVGYADTASSPTDGTLILKTDANGCFAVLSEDSTGAVLYPPAQPSASPCFTSDFTVLGTNASPTSAGLPEDDGGIQMPFVSNRVDSLQVSVGSGSDYQAWTPATSSYVFAGTGVNTLQPNLTPNPVKFDGVTMNATSPAAWSAATFQILPATGSATGLSMSASGTGTVGTLSFTDANAGTSGYIRPGAYTINVSLTGFEPAQGQLVCYAPDTAGADPSALCQWQGSTPELVKDGQITVTTTPGALVQLTAVGPAIASNATVNGVATPWSPEGSGVYTIQGTAVATSDPAVGKVVFGNLRPVDDTSTANYSLSLIAPPGYYSGTMDPGAADDSTFWVAPECYNSGSTTNLVTTSASGSYFGLVVDGDVTCSADLHGVPVVTVDPVTGDPVLDPATGLPETTTTNLATGTISGTVVGYESTTGTTPQMPVNGVFVQAFYCNGQSSVDTSAATCDITGVTATSTTTTANDHSSANGGLGNDGTFTLAGGAGHPLVAGYYEVRANGINGWADDKDTPTTVVVDVTNGTVSPAGTLALRQVPATLDISVNYLDHGTPHQYDGATITLTNTQSTSDTCSVGVGTANPVAVAGSGLYHCPNPLTPGTYNWTISSPAYAGQSGTYTLGSGAGTLPITLTPFATSFSGAITVDDGATLSSLHHDTGSVPDPTNPGVWVYVCAGPDGADTNDCWPSGVITGTDGAPVRIQPNADGSFVLANIPANATGQYYYVWIRDAFDSYKASSYKIPQSITSSLSTSISVPAGALQLKAMTGTTAITLKPTDSSDQLCGATVTLSHSGLSPITKTIPANCSAGPVTISSDPGSVGDFGSLARGQWTLTVNTAGLSKGGTHTGAGVLYCVSACDPSATSATISIPAGGSTPTAASVYVIEKSVTPRYYWSNATNAIVHTPPNVGIDITATNDATGVSTTLPTTAKPSGKGVSNAASCTTGCPLWIGPGEWDFSGSFTGSQDDSWTLSTTTDTVTSDASAATPTVAPTVTLTGTNATAPSIVLTEAVQTTTIHVNLAAPDGSAVNNATVKATSAGNIVVRATTNVTGIATFSGANALSTGTWTIVVEAGSNAIAGPPAGTLTWQQSDAQTLTAATSSALNTSLSFTINPTVTAVFNVSDQFGNPVTGATVRLPDSGATTSGAASCTTNSGTCPITGVMPNNSGGWDVSVTNTPTGYSAASTLGISVTTCTTSGGGTSCNGDPATPGSVPVTITMPILVSDATFDVQSAFGVPLAGVTLTISGRAQGKPDGTLALNPTCTTSDGAQDTNGDGTVEAAGTCVMSNIIYRQGGSWPVTVTPTGGFAASGVVFQATGSSVTVPVSMSVITKNVSVTFKDGSGTPLAGASVTLNTPTPISCGPTNSTGTCTLNGVPYNFGSAQTYSGGGHGQGTAGTAWIATVTSPTGYSLTTTPTPTVTIPPDGSSPAPMALTFDTLKVDVLFTITDDAAPTHHYLDGVTVAVPSATASTCVTGSNGSDPQTGAGTGSCIIPGVPYNLAHPGTAWTVTLAKSGYDAPSDPTTFVINANGTVDPTNPQRYAMKAWTVDVGGTVTGADASTVSVTAICQTTCTTDSPADATVDTPSGGATTYSGLSLGMGTWKIKATASGYADGSTTVVITTGADGTSHVAKVGGAQVTSTAIGVALGDPVQASPDVTIDLTLSDGSAYTGGGTLTATLGSDTKTATITGGSATFSGTNALYYSGLDSWNITASGTTHYDVSGGPLTVQVDADGHATTTGGLTFTEQTGTVTLTGVPVNATSVTIGGSAASCTSGTCTVDGLGVIDTHHYVVEVPGYNTVEGDATTGTSVPIVMGSPWTVTVHVKVTGVADGDTAQISASASDSISAFSPVDVTSDGITDIQLGYGTWSITLTGGDGTLYTVASDGSGTATVLSSSASPSEVDLTLTPAPAGG